MRFVTSKAPRACRIDADSTMAEVRRKPNARSARCQPIEVFAVFYCLARASLGPLTR